MINKSKNNTLYPYYQILKERKCIYFCGVFGGGELVALVVGCGTPRHPSALLLAFHLRSGKTSLNNLRF